MESMNLENSLKAVIFLRAGNFCHGFWSIFTDPWFLQHTIIKEASWKPPNEHSDSLWECSIEAIWRLNLAWLLAQVLIRGDFHSTKLRKGSPEKIAVISNWVATKYWLISTKCIAYLLQNFIAHIPNFSLLACFPFSLSCLNLRWFMAHKIGNC